jgi:hypothetical protein
MLTSPAELLQKSRPKALHDALQFLRLICPQVRLNPPFSLAAATCAKEDTRHEQQRDPGKI